MGGSGGRRGSYHRGRRGSYHIEGAGGPGAGGGLIILRGQGGFLGQAGVESY